MWSELMYMLQSDNCLYLLTHITNILFLIHTLCIHRSQVVMQDGGDTTINGTSDLVGINPITSLTIRVITDHKGSITVLSD